MRLENHLSKRLKQVLPNRLKRGARKLRDSYHFSTSRWRALPDFLVIGAMRAGSDSIFSYLIQHPQILGSYIKETHYFDWNYSKGVGWYRSNFPSVFEVKENTRVGEATPDYLVYPHIPKRIHALLPDAKLIAILRNPTYRAISHYFFTKFFGWETLPLMDALLAEEERIRPKLEKMLQDESYFNDDTIWFSYKQRGLYIEQLRKYWEVFDRKQILIIDNRKLLNETRDTLKIIFEFLEIDPDIEIKNLSRKNVTNYPADIPLSVYQYLNEFFAPFNEQLFVEIGQDFGW
jgi:hypothetical protein